MRIRLVLFRLLIVLLFAGLAARLWRLQVVDGARYRAWADENRFRLVTTQAPRGVIYDRGERLLVRNIPTFSVDIVPAYLPEGAAGTEMLARLVEVLGIPSLSVAALH